MAVDYRGEIYGIARYAGVRNKQLKGRIGDPAKLPSVDQAKQDMADRMTAMLRHHITQAERAHKLRSASLTFQRNQTLQRQRDEREKLQQMQEARRIAETRMRAQRLSRGFRGVWDRLTGKYAQIKRQNEREALLAFYRDREEKDGLIFRQIEERQKLQSRIRNEKKEHALDVQRLHRDIAGYKDMRSGAAQSPREHFERVRDQRGRSRERDRDRSREP